MDKGIGSEAPEKVNFTLKNKITGFIRGDTFFTVRGPEHLFRKFRGFGASISVLAELQKRDVMYYCVVFRPNIHISHEYKAMVSDFYLFGEKYSDGKDKQLVLTVDLFNKNEKVISETQEQLTKNHF